MLPSNVRASIDFHLLAGVENHHRRRDSLCQVLSIVSEIKDKPRQLLYRLYRFFFVIRHLRTHYRAHLKVSTKPGQDDTADVEESRRGRRYYKKADRSSLVGFLIQHQVDAAGFGRTPQALPFVQLGDNLLHLSRHGLEAPLSTAVNVVAAFKRDHIAIPVGAFPARRRLCSPDRYDLVGLFHC